MPNVSFDIFFDQDFINISASRGKHAPKAKPDWKVRTAPKLPPKEPVAEPGVPRPNFRPPINSTRPPAKLAHKAFEDKPQQQKPSQSSEAGSEAADKPRRKPPKLGPKKSASTNEATDIPAPEGVKASA